MEHNHKHKRLVPAARRLLGKALQDKDIVRIGIASGMLEVFSNLIKDQKHAIVTFATRACYYVGHIPEQVFGCDLAPLPLAPEGTHDRLC
jgi:hypothetical protein